MVATALDNQIESVKNKVAVMDDRIGRLMSRRADLEDKLAGLYKKRRAPSNSERTDE